MTDPLQVHHGNAGNGTGPFVAGVQSSSIPIIFIETTGDANTIVMANTSFLRMTGFEYSKILGKSVDAAFAEMATRTDIEYINERLAEDQPGTWDIVWRRADRSTYLASIFMHPLRDRAGIHQQHILSFYVSHDPETRLNNNADEARLLYKHAPGFIATSEGPHHRVTFANNAYKQFVGYDNLEGLTVAEAMPEIAEQGFVAILDRVFESGVPYRGEAVPFEFLDTKSGEPVRRYANFVYEPVRDAQLNIVGIFCEGYDVTHQKEAEAALKIMQTQVAHASRVNAMGTMATTIAHELNQPLSAIVNYSGGCLRLIDSQDTNNDVVKRALLSIQDAANRAGAIIRTLRDLTDRRVRSSAIFKLRPVVEESLNLVRSASSLDTQLEAIISADLTLNADRIQIQQVIINLVRNGCDAVAQSVTQKVTVLAQATSDDIIVSVRDTGPGIEAEIAQSIFTWSDTLKDEGMGLGLSICRTIIESHGGRIWLEESSETGSEFRFSVPITNRESTKAVR